MEKIAINRVKQYYMKLHHIYIYIYIYAITGKSLRLLSIIQLYILHEHNK